MSDVPVVSVVEYKSQSAQIKDYKISVFCLSTKCIALGSNNKDWLESGYNNVRVEQHVYPWTVVLVR